MHGIIIVPSSPITVTGTILTGQFISNVSSTVGLLVGMALISPTGYFPAGTTISAISTATPYYLTMSNQGSGSYTGNITFK